MALQDFTWNSRHRLFYWGNSSQKIGAKWDVQGPRAKELRNAFFFHWCKLQTLLRSPSWEAGTPLERRSPNHQGLNSALSLPVVAFPTSSGLSEPLKQLGSLRPCNAGLGASPVAQWSRIHLQCRSRRRCRFNPWIRKIPWRREWQPVPAFLPGKSHWTGGLQSTGLQRVGHDWSDLARTECWGDL